MNDTETPDPRARLALFASLLCMAPTAAALSGGLLLTLINAAAYDAVHNQGEDQYLLGFSLVFSVIAGFVGGGILSLMGLVLHTIGSALAVVAIKGTHRIGGALLLLMHTTMLVVDVAFIVGWMVLIASN